jgi:hypothetical protein
MGTEVEARKGSEKGKKKKENREQSVPADVTVPCERNQTKSSETPE